MSIVSFDKLPDSSRLWIFHTLHPLTEEESGEFMGFVNRFMQEWASHQAEVTAGSEMKYRQFVLVGADESRVGVSGCSNDSLFRAMKTIFREMNLEFPMVPPVLYRDSDSIRCVSREEFRDLIKMGLVNEETVVFNNLIHTVGDYRKGLWEVPMKKSWHFEAFPIPVRK